MWYSGYMVARHVNPRKQGDAGMGMAIAWFTNNEYTVNIPLTDSQPYDLVVEDQTDGSLHRVSVKTTTRDNCEVSLRTQGGNKSQMVVRHFDSSSVELLFVAAPHALYLIPASKVASKSTISVKGKKYDEYIVQV